MARLWSIGYELNSVTSAMEFDASSGSQDFIDTTTVRSGTYSYRALTASGDGKFRHQIKAAGTYSLFLRAYFRIATAPDKQIEIMSIQAGTHPHTLPSIRLNADRTLELWNASAQIGSDSSALSINTWYRIELNVDNTGAGGTHTIIARIDGSNFATTTTATVGNISFVSVGAAEDNDLTVAAGDFYFDDVAVNDSTGSFQNSWPGEGEIIHLRPSATGDNTGWNNGVSTNDYQEIDEITPDDATTYIGEVTTDVITDVNITDTPVALASDDTINCVQVGLRFATNTLAGTDPLFVLRIKASASGTVEETSNLAPQTTWYTHAIAVPRIHPLTLYDLPGASTTAWTKSDLDTTQIGARQTVDSNGRSEISAMWLLVDHKPGAAPPATTTRTTAYMTTNTSFWGF